MTMYASVGPALFAFLFAAAPGVAAEAPPSPPALPVERQLPFDDAGKVLELDGNKAREVGLITDEKFERVRLFESSGSYFLELESSRGDRLERVRRPVTPEQLVSVKSRLASAATSTEPRQEARIALLGTTTLLGFTYYGAAIGSLPPQDLFVPAYLLTGAASVALPWLLTRKTEVTWGETGLAFYGGTRGILFGELAARVIGSDFANDVRLARSMGTATSVAALTGGFLWARFDALDSGEAHLVGVGGDAGLFAGLALARIFGSTNTPEARARLFGILGLGGAGLGLAGGRLFSSIAPHTFGDAEVLRTAGIVGMLGGLAVGSRLDVGSNRDTPFMVGGLIGSAIGLTVGEVLVRDRRLSTLEGLLIDLGTLAGGVAGFLTSMLIAPNGPNSREFLWLTGEALGAAAGFGTAFVLLAPARGERRERDALAESLHLSLSPVALLMPAERTEMPPPLVTLSWTPTW